MNYPNLRFLIIASGFQPAYITEVTNAYANLGCTVVLIGGDIHQKGPYADGVQFINLRGDDSPHRTISQKIRGLLTYYIRLIACVRRMNSSILYFAGLGGAFIDLLCLYSLFRIWGRQIIHTVHNILPHEGYSTTQHRIYTFVYQHIASFLVIHTQHLKTKVIDEFQVSPDKIIVGYHGTYHRTHQRGLTKPTARDTLGIDQDRFVFLSFGYQRQYKGTHFLLDVVRDLKDIKPCHLIRGTVNNPSYAELIENMIHTQQLSQLVDCEFGYVSDEALSLYFTAADVIVLPYLEDVSQSGVLFMAYAFGRPVIASRIGSFTEHIQPGVTGEIFDTHDRDALIEMIRKVQSHYSDYSENAIIQYANTHYSWRVFADTVAETIHKGETAPCAIS